MNNDVAFPLLYCTFKVVYIPDMIRKTAVNACNLVCGYSKIQMLSGFLLVKIQVLPSEMPDGRTYYKFGKQTIATKSCCLFRSVQNNALRFKDIAGKIIAGL